MAQNEFVHLHLHSEYSLLDGACRFDTLFDRVKALGMNAVALTDHGNLFGAFDFYHDALKKAIKPLIGCEVYLAPGSRFDKNGTEDRSNQHFILLAENEQGYRTLAKLSSLAYAEGFYYKPRIDRELLERNHAGLVGLSACLKGPICEALLEGDEQGALKAVDDFHRILGTGNFYLELMDHGMPEQKKVNEGILRLAKQTGLPLVATNDCHYLNHEDNEIHDVLMCISMGKNLDDERRLRFSSDQLYVKSPQEMIEMFGHITGAIGNTVALAERLNPKISTGLQLYPSFQPPDAKTDAQYIRELALAGEKKRFPNGLPDETVFRERLEHELKIIDRMGFNSYYLVVWDFIQYAKNHGIPVGPGRGSGAASLVAYYLEITDLDPIRHNLVFERFLNPERVDPPDFDIDFCFERRGQVIEYVKKKYGDGNVAQIVTFGTQKAKNAVRDVGRVMGVPIGDVDRIAKLIPETLNITLDESLTQSAELKELYERDATVKRVIDYARRIEGSVRHSSIHAAGVVIADQELNSIVPTFKPGGHDDVATQYAMKQVTKLGLLKMDFLGLKNLTIIDRCMGSVKDVHGVEINWQKIPDDDPKTYEMLQAGDAFGVFQLESGGMRELLRKLKPESFAEITALIALYRPGPMAIIPEFINRKFGRSPIEYDHEMLEPILRETYGFIVYQEQVQQIAAAMAGYSMGQADLLRRAMGKKDLDEMKRQEKVFIEGAVKRGVGRKTAEKVFALMAEFAKYGFNKAHSAAYAVVTFRTAYLKAHYPVEYMAALLTNEIGAANDKLGMYIGKAREAGIPALPPDINESNAVFTPVGDSIRFGLAAIKNVGAGVVEAIVEERRKGGPFGSLQSFCERVHHKALNARMLDALIRAGAFDSLGATRPQLLAIIGDCIEMASHAKRDKEAGQGSLFDELGGGAGAAMTEIPLPDVADWSDKEKLQNERELLGFFVSGHPLDAYAPDMRGFATLTSHGLSEAKERAEATMIGVVAGIQFRYDKSGAKWAILQLEDLEGSFEALAFARSYEKLALTLQEDAVLWLRGRVNARNESRSLVIDDAVPIDEARGRHTKFVDLHLRPEQIQGEDLKSLRRAVGRHKGRCPLRLHIMADGGGEILVEAGAKYKVQPSEPLTKDLKALGLEKALTYSAG